MMVVLNATTFPSAWHLGMRTDSQIGMLQDRFEKPTRTILWGPAPKAIKTYQELHCCQDCYICKIYQCCYYFDFLQTKFPVAKALTPICEGSGVPGSYVRMSSSSTYIFSLWKWFSSKLSVLHLIKTHDFLTWEHGCVSWETIVYHAAVALHQR